MIPVLKLVTRVRIVHPHDIYKGCIGYVQEKIDQHSLYTYVVCFKNSDGSWTDRRAYQREDIKILKSVKTPKGLYQ